MTRFQRPISASTKARQLYPDAFCQPMRPCSAIACRCRSRGVGAISAVSLGTPLERGGTMTAASGLLQIGGIETLGEPAVDGREQIARFGPPAVLAPQPG